LCYVIFAGEKTLKTWCFLAVRCFLVLCAATAVLSAQTASPPQTPSASPAQQFYGIWYNFPLGNPTTDPIRHEFRHNATAGRDEMIVSRLCPGDYRSVTAKAITPVEITEDSVRVLKSVSDSREGEGRSVCRATIEAGVWSYSVSDDDGRITMTNPGGNPDLLVLARQGTETDPMLLTRVYGTWRMITEKGTTSIVARWVFFNGADGKHSNLRQIVSCSRGSDALLSQVDSAITISKDEIAILDSDTHEERDGPLVCRATISPETLHYAISLDGATMTLSKAGQKPMVLTREH
jgi:hypothetical protein